MLGGYATAAVVLLLVIAGLDVVRRRSRGALLTCVLGGANERDDDGDNNLGQVPPPGTKRMQRTPRDPNARLRWRVLERDGNRCRLCGRSPNDGARLHVDHIVPWSVGGETT